jgi:hypothetical protein
MSYDLQKNISATFCLAKTAFNETMIYDSFFGVAEKPEF